MSEIVSAEYVKKLRSKNVRGVPVGYPWDLWLDGNIHALTPGSDFNTPTPTLRVSARVAAASRGKRVSVKSYGTDKVFIQAFNK